MKRTIPNILTTYRSIVAILIPLLFFNGYYYILTILFIVAIISDMLDGYLARRWNVVSTYGKIADAVGDKLLAISASFTFIIAINKLFIITLILELLIMLIFISSYIIKNKDFSRRNSSIYGKVKTVFLFFTLLIGYVSYEIKYLQPIIFILIIITSILQIITLITYILKKDIKSS